MTDLDSAPYLGHITEPSGGDPWSHYVLYIWVPQTSLNADCWTVSGTGQEVESFGLLERDKVVNEH